MKKIVSDTEHKINNTLIPQERKIFLYSGHENNIASMLELLNLRNGVQIPQYGSHILIELHLINGTHGVKVRSFVNNLTVKHKFQSSRKKKVVIEREIDGNSQS